MPVKLAEQVGVGDVGPKSVFLMPRRRPAAEQTARIAKFSLVTS